MITNKNSDNSNKNNKIIIIITIINGIPKIEIVRVGVIKAAST